MKRRSLLTTAILLAALAGLALLITSGTPRAQTGPTLSIDTDPSAAPANDASTVGTIEPCVSVSSGPVPFEIDLTIQGVTSLSAVEGDLLYDESVLTVTAMDDSFILAQGVPPPILLNLSDPLPDTDGTFRILLASTGEGSGDGVIARFSIQPNAAGTSPLTLDKIKLRDFDNVPIGPVDGNGFYIGPINNGTAAVDTTCSPDSDNDGVPDATDNCPSLSNPYQANTDADNEAAGFRLGTGSPPPILTGDSDGDACDTDDDNDAFTDADEQAIFGVGPGSADELTPCRTDTLDDPWPPDLFGSGGLPDRVVNFQDLNAMVPKLFSSPPGPPYDVRFDLFDPTGAFINFQDLNLAVPFLFQGCEAPP